MLTGAALLGLSWVFKAKAAGNLLFFPGNVNRVYFEGSTPVFEVAVIVQNTSAVTLTLSSFAANVLAKQMDSFTVIGNLSGFNPIIIPGNSEGAILVKLRLFAGGIVTDIVRAWSVKNYKQEIFISGGVHVAGIPPVRVPIEMSFNVGA